MEFYREGPKYEDWQDAGRMLSKRLLDQDIEKPVILAIPNGGEAVALPVFALADAYRNWSDISDAEVKAMLSRYNYQK